MSLEARSTSTLAKGTAHSSQHHHSQREGNAHYKGAQSGEDHRGDHHEVQALCILQLAGKGLGKHQGYRIGGEEQGDVGNAPLSSQDVQVCSGQAVGRAEQGGQKHQAQKFHGEQVTQFDGALFPRGLLAAAVIGQNQHTDKGDDRGQGSRHKGGAKAHGIPQGKPQSGAHCLGQRHHQAKVAQALPHAVPGDKLTGVSRGKHRVDGEKHTGARPQENEERDAVGKCVAQQEQRIAKLCDEQQPLAVHAVGNHARHRGHEHPHQGHDAGNGRSQSQLRPQVQRKTGHQGEGHLPRCTVCQVDQDQNNKFPRPQLGRLAPCFPFHIGTSTESLKSQYERYYTKFSCLPSIKKADFSYK